MKHFYIIVNPRRDQQLKLTKELQNFIEDNGGVCDYQVNREEEGMTFEESRIPADTECILVVGGDGTLLRAARNMAARNIPLIGINTGHVGYLCELERDSAIQGIRRLLDGAEYVVEQRMLLSGSCVCEGGAIAGRLALNDIVIHRCGALQAMDFVLSVNGEHLNTYNADGIIIATPTGSTAYSMSAGGPIVDPQAKLLVVTPICPHTLNAKSIVLGAEDEIAIEVQARGEGQREKAEVSFDGAPVGTLTAGEQIVVKKAQACTGILKLSRQSFLERLRKKLQGYAGE